MSLQSLVENFLGMPELASVHGAEVDKLVVFVHYLMAILFLGWVAYFLYALVRFRKARHPKADYHGLRGHMTTYIELAVVAVEALLLIGFAVPLWAKVVDELPADEDSTVFRVIAQQFAWNSVYPGADAKFGPQDASLLSSDNRFGIIQDHPDSADDVIPAVNDIHVPVDKPVVVKRTSMDVIHSFKLYNMRVNQDAIPGLMVPIHFTPTKVGKYQIVCAQLCGNSHAYMRGFFTVDTQEDYDAWLAELSAAPAETGGFE